MYIGNTGGEPGNRCGPPVYPYVYREHVRVQSDFLFQKRFIPMYIGNTEIIAWVFSWIAVYPYVYREHHLMDMNFLCFVGLSLCI